MLRQMVKRSCKANTKKKERKLRGDVKPACESVPPSTPPMQAFGEPLVLPHGAYLELLKKKSGLNSKTDARTR